MERLTNHFDYCKMVECKFYDPELRKQDKCKFFDISIEHCYEKRMNDKLREYEDAEEQRLLIKIPYAVGDMVYWAEKEVYLFEIMSIRLDKCGINARLSYRGTDENKRYWVIETSIEKLSERCFQTRAEAEKALAELQSK